MAYNHELISIFSRKIHFPYLLDFEYAIRSDMTLNECHEYYENVLKEKIVINLDEIEFEHSKISQLNAKILYPGHCDYPTSFCHMDDPPLFITYRGQPIWKKQGRLTVVGSRNMTEEVGRWMRTHLTQLCLNGITIVSGAARGVDQESHRIAICNRAPTISILPSGLNAIYPLEFAKDIDNILQLNGAVMSEYLPSATIHKKNFHERNRLLAALGQVTLITMANFRSGTMITAKHSMNLDRPVVTIPWSAIQPQYAGSNYLIKCGAFTCTEYEDIKALLDMSTIQDQMRLTV